MTEHTQREGREGVRQGILSAIKRDVELRGGRTARLLVGAGIAGVLGGVGATLLTSPHPDEHHPPWHVAIVGGVWIGLLIVSFALVFLNVRTPSLALARSARVGLLGLGIAGVCGAACPEAHFLDWWSATIVGLPLTQIGGLELSALCFGFIATFFFGATAAFAVLGGRGPRAVRPILPAVFVAVLLTPGVVLQSVGSSPGVLVPWLGGTLGGAYLGVVGGIWARTRSGLPA